MPFYEYECPSCKYYAEVLQKITEKPLKKCPSCGKAGFRKLVSAPVFRLKGSGWYETDFKGESDNKRNLAGAEREPPAAETKADAKPAAEAKAGGEGKGEAKAEAKSEGKGEGKGEGKAAAGAKSAAEAKGSATGKAAGGRRSASRRPATRAVAKNKPARGGKRR
jgi:putative FmdB family regulatory protein